MLYPKQPGRDRQTIGVSAQKPSLIAVAVVYAEPSLLWLIGMPTDRDMKPPWLQADPLVVIGGSLGSMKLLKS